MFNLFRRLLRPLSLCCLPVYSNLNDIECIMCPNRTKLDTAHLWARNKTHDKCEADEMNGS